MRFDNNKNPLNIPLFGKEFSFPKKNINRCIICGYHVNHNYLLAWLIEKVQANSSCKAITKEIVGDIIGNSFNKKKEYRLVIIEPIDFINNYPNDPEVIKWLNFNKK